MVERTSVGLDVHARSVAAAAIDGVTGELRQARLTPSHDQIRSWIGELAGPVAVAYEAGPTGFGLYRALTAAGVRCVVAAPSKLQRPSGDRVKTDAKDAVHLARLLRLGEITAVAVPSVEQEAARDLVRAREDCRGDLMRARHRLSKLLLRHGIVYSGGQAWTGRARCAGCAGSASTTPPPRWPSSPTTRRCWRSPPAGTGSTRRSPRWPRDSEFTPVVRRLGCLRGSSTLTAFALAVEIGDWHRFTGNSIGSFVGLVPSEHSSGTSRVQGSITKTGNTHARRLLVEAAWHHRPATGPARPCATGGNWPRRPPGPAATPATGACTQRWVSFNLRRKKRRRSPTSPSPANWPAGAGPWPSSNN